MSTTKADQAAATTAHLIATARKLFAARGYEAVGTEEIVQRAKVTRGALYHHFADKRALFEAVVESVMRDLHGRLAEAARGLTGDPWGGLHAGVDAFLLAAGETEVLRIALQDAPSVLGWARWRELDSRFGLGLLEHALEEAMAMGQIPRQPVRTAAHLLVAALGEAALMLARDPDSAKTRSEVKAALERILEGFRVRHSEVGNPQ